MSAHAWWRINVTANNGGTYLSLAEIEMRATIGGADQCNGGSVVFSTQNDTSANAAANAFDNNTSSKWTTAGIATGYIGYHFTAPVDVRELVIIGPIPGQSLYAPKDFSLQYSDDGSVWFEFGSWSNETAWTDYEQRIFIPFIATFTGNITESLAITNWRITASRCVDGVLANSIISGEGGTSYQLYLTTLLPCNITISPKIDYMWTAGKIAVLDDYVVASNPDATPHLWKCTAVAVDNTTGGTEPTWNLSGTTIDNNVTWTYVAPLVDPVTIGPKIPTPL